MFDNIVSIAATDDHTVILIAEEHRPRFPVPAGPDHGRRSSSPRAPTTNTTKPVGTGPYKLDSWTKGSSMVLTQAGTATATPAR